MVYGGCLQQGQGGQGAQAMEALSPPMAPELLAEDQSFRTTKDELLQQIAKVDRDIALNEQALAKLKKKASELEEIASKPAAGSKEVESEVIPKHRSLAQKIYTENRKKASSSHLVLLPLYAPEPFPNVPRNNSVPHYNQPQDTEVYHENKKRHMAYKSRLQEYFRKRHLEDESRNNYLVQTYTDLSTEWLRKVDKVENSQKRKAKEAKNREFFEKVFPELRKQREDKERFNRVGARIKSEADLEEIMDGLQEQELEDKKMRSYAVIPPIMHDPRRPHPVYTDTNGVCPDMEREYKERQNLNVWTNSEREVFKEKYLQHPKAFGVIASYLDRKSVQDCVQYYYLSKKTENYKQLLRKSRQRTRSSRNPQKVNSQNPSSIIDILSTGVTTRLQREQQQKTGKDNKENLRQSASSGDDSKNARDPLAISQKDLAMAAAKEKESSKDSNSVDIDVDTKAFITPVTICLNSSASGENSNSTLSNSVTLSTGNVANSPGHIVNFGINSVPSSVSPDLQRVSPVVVGINAGNAIVNSPSNGLGALPTTYLGQAKQAPEGLKPLRTPPPPHVTPVAPIEVNSRSTQDNATENQG